MKTKRKKLFQRLPFALALFVMIPEAFVAWSQDAFHFGLLLAAILANVWALRVASGIPKVLELATLGLDSAMAFYSGWQHLARGTQAVHIVWFVAGMGFLVAACICGFKTPKPTTSDPENTHDQPSP